MPKKEVVTTGRKKELTAKQKLFVKEYIIDLNATQAAIRAGYSKKTAKDMGYSNLKLDYVKAEIDRILKEKDDVLIAKAEEVLKYLTSVMRGEAVSEIVVVEGEGDGCSSARRVNKLPDEKERLRAAELLGKRYGLFKDKVDMEITPVTILDDVEE